MKGGRTVQKQSKTAPSSTSEKKPSASKNSNNAPSKWATTERPLKKDETIKKKDSFDSQLPRRPKKEGVPSAKPTKRAAVESETGDDSDNEHFDENISIDMGSDSEADEDTAVEDEEVVSDFTYAGEESEEELIWDDEGKSKKNVQGAPKLDNVEQSDDYLSGDSLEDSQADEDYDELFSDSDREDKDEIEPGYSSDSSTEETTNTVGNIPMEWYDDLPHIGYDRDGRKILRPATKDELDAFLANVDDVDGWRTVTDKLEGKDVVLTDEELDIIRRLQNQQFTDKNYDPYEPLVEFFSSKTMQSPLSAAPEPKRRFIPSKWEAKTIMKIVRAIRDGRIIPRRNAVAPRPQYYDLWGPSGGDAEESERKSNHPMHIPAPKVRLPDHSESYNPPSEYLLTEKERAEWEATDAEDRERNFVPAKHSNLRSVPGYNRFIQERFARCLDLYLCPRVKKNRLNIDPESLIPKLPDACDLEPFPRSLAITYRGHNGRIRCLSLDPSGLWLVTGGDDGDVRMWEVATGRCMQVWKCGAHPIQSVEWCPNKDVWIFAAAFDNKVALIVPQDGADPAMITFAEQIAHAGFATATSSSSESVKVPVAKWSKPTPEEETSGWRAVVGVTRGLIKNLTWHRKGDYFATVAPEANSTAVLVHQLSKHATQAPFRKTKGLVQKVLFHPAKPFLFVATQRYIRVYNLLKQVLARTLQPGCKWISSMDIHPSGNHVLIGSYDRRVSWFDLDLSPRPYKTLRHHSAAVRSVAYASRSGYPLFATASDDGSVQIFHGQVYADLLQNPLLVPVKRLKNAHGVKEGLGVLSCVWHPTQPWLFTTGADGVAKMWC